MLECLCCGNPVKDKNVPCSCGANFAGEISNRNDISELGNTISKFIGECSEDGFRGEEILCVMIQVVVDHALVNYNRDYAESLAELVKKRIRMRLGRLN